MSQHPPRTVFAATERLLRAELGLPGAPLARDRAAEAASERA